MTFRRLILLFMLALPGCWITGRKPEPVVVDPVLSTSVSRDELVDYLNSKTAGLQSWRCRNTQVYARSPALPIPQRLKGTLACAAPGQFRLVCDNTLGHGDFGANQEICWAYIKPGPSEVVTWKHEDSSILQSLDEGVPRLEPEWLMTILGIQALDPERYELQNAPQGSREVWLVAVESAADGTSLRRVIKVDTLQGVAREHALYDYRGEHLLRVHLSDYRNSGGHHLPHSVRIEFPKMRTELNLSFAEIETGCHIEEALWSPPQHRGLKVVDLGDIARQNLKMHSPDDSGRDLRAERGDEAVNRLDGIPERTDPPVRFTGDEEEQPLDVGAETSDGPDDSGTEPLGDDRFFQGEEDDAQSEIPDFDVVAPSESPGKRRSWFPLWKFRKD